MTAMCVCVRVRVYGVLELSRSRALRARDAAVGVVVPD